MKINNTVKEIAIVSAQFILVAAIISFILAIFAVMMQDSDDRNTSSCKDHYGQDYIVVNEFIGFAGQGRKCYDPVTDTSKPLIY